MRRVLLLVAFSLPLPHASSQSRPGAANGSAPNTNAANSANAASSGESSPAASASATDTYHLHGIVVDSHTGKPVARALVQAYGDRVATMSDHDGRFAVDIRFLSLGGAADMVRRTMATQQVLFLGLTARKPGYANNMFPPNMQSISLAALEQDIILKLTPEAVIQGRVAASTDDRPENVRLSLMIRRYQDGYGVWQQMASAATNSRGEFRFGNLQPGDYRVTTQEWAEGAGQPLQVLQPFLTDKPVPRYAPVAYPAGGAGAASSQVHLAAGEILPINLNLHPEAFYPVHIPIVLPSGVAGVQIRVKSASGVSGFNLRYNARSKAVEGMLPRGAYEVTLQANGQDPTAATVPLAVGGSAVEVAPVTLLPLASIPVIVHQDFTHQAPAGRTGPAQDRSSPVQLNLVSEEMNGPAPALHSGSGQQDSLVLEHVFPGAYRVQMSSVGYVAAATSGGTDLLRAPLVVSAGGGASPIEITLRDDGATVQGSIDPAALSPATNPGYTFILCLPSEPSAQRVVQATTGPDGKFRLFNVPPGSYRIFASLQPFNNVDYRSESFLKKNGSKGYAVTLEPDASATVTLTALLDEEP